MTTVMLGLVCCPSATGANDYALCLAAAVIGMTALYLTQARALARGRGKRSVRPGSLSPGRAFDGGAVAVAGGARRRSALGRSGVGRGALRRFIGRQRRSLPDVRSSTGDSSTLV
jgi:hypothetical protein